MKNKTLKTLLALICAGSLVGGMAVTNVAQAHGTRCCYSYYYQPCGDYYHTYKVCSCCHKPVHHKTCCNKSGQSGFWPFW